MLKKVYNKYLFECIFLIYALTLLIFSWTPVYIEGDDSYTILYHLLGRDVSVQGPFSYYHSGVDFLLSFLPQDENALRIFTFGISFFSTIVFLFFSLKLLKRWVGEELSSVICFIFLILFLPELSFMGLVYSPTSIALSFLMISHFLLVKYSSDKRLLLLAIILFGYGVTCRWNTAFYGFVIIFTLFVFEEKWSLNRIILLSSLLITTILLSFLLEGIGLEEIKATLNYSKSVTSGIGDSSLKFRILNSLTFFTPFSLLFIAIGIVKIWIEREWRKYLILLPVVINFLVFKNLHPKFHIVFLPLYGYLLLEGILFLKNRVKKKYIILIITLPWIFGLKITTDKTVWGPGFELANKKEKIRNISINKNLDIKNNTNFRLAFLNGFAVPTIDGPRPLGGYIGVLLYYWKAFHEDLDNQLNELVDYSIKNSVDIYRFGGTSIIENKLLKSGCYLNSFVRNNRSYKCGSSELNYYMYGKNEYRLSLLQKKSPIILYSNYSSLISDISVSLKLSNHYLIKRSHPLYLFVNSN